MRCPDGQAAVADESRHSNQGWKHGIERRLSSDEDGLPDYYRIQLIPHSDWARPSGLSIVRFFNEQKLITLNIVECLPDSRRPLNFDRLRYLIRSQSEMDSRVAGRKVAAGGAGGGPLACVPTGINTGVSMTPCAVVNLITAPMPSRLLL